MFLIKPAEQNCVRAWQYYCNNIIFITKEFLSVCDRNIKVNFDPCFTVFNDIEDILTLYFVTHSYQKDPILLPWWH